MMIEKPTQNLDGKKRLKQFRDEMECVWEEFQNTGLHTTGEEVFSWMDSWFDDDEKPLPAQHC